MGLSLLEHALVSRACSGARRSATTCFNCQAPDAGNMEILIAHGTRRAEAALARAARARARSAAASRMTEPEHAGLEPDLAGDHAPRRDGDDYVINGHKWFTSSRRRRGVRHRHGGDQPRRRRRTRAPADHRAHRRAGLRAACATSRSWATPATTAPATPRCATTTCACPWRTCSGRRARASCIAQERLGPGRIHHCMRWIGICERAFDLMCARAASRAARAGQAARHQADRAGVDRREPRRDRRRAPDGAARRLDASTARARTRRASEISLHQVLRRRACSQRVLDRAIQVHGALGMTDDTPLACWYRHERARAHLRRPGRGAQDGGGQAHLEEARRVVVSAPPPSDAGPNAPLDPARAVRPGEELDARALAQFLGWDEVRVSQFPSGHSNLTYLVEGGAQGHNRQLVLRRPPFGSKVKTAHDMGREFRILSQLARGLSAGAQARGVQRGRARSSARRST